MPDLPHYATGPIACPGCGASLDGHLATRPGVAPPTPNDTATICAHCSTIAIFTTVLGQLALRRPTDTELDELLTNPQIALAIRAVKQHREGTPR